MFQALNLEAQVMIKVQNVYKRYRSVHALEDLSLEVPQGAIYGLIGPNGAGKTTLLRILGALISPTAGRVWFDDEEVSRSPTAIQRKVGYMPEYTGLHCANAPALLRTCSNWWISPPNAMHWSRPYLAG